MLVAEPVRAPAQSDVSDRLSRLSSWTSSLLAAPVERGPRWAYRRLVVSRVESSIVTFSRSGAGGWQFRAITPDGPFEERDLEFSTPESLIASNDVDVVRDSGALRDGRTERRRLEIRRVR